MPIAVQRTLRPAITDKGKLLHILIRIDARAL